MKAPIDIATRVSPQLSAAIEKLVNDPDREEPPTLYDVQSAVRRHTSDAERHDLLFRPQERASMLAEVDGLVDEFGPEAPAIDFVSAKASEELSRVIERVVEIAKLSHRPTLAGVRDAMTGGLVAQLIGDGAIEPDDDQALQAEIDVLIERHGEDALAEEFVRFE
ncbi:MAG: hypothetical protein ACM3JC_03075 [Rudaea sp.]